MLKASPSKLDKVKYLANFAQYLVNSKLPKSFSGRQLSSTESEDKILSRQKRQFSVFSLLNFLLVVFNVVLDINNNIRERFISFSLIQDIIIISFGLKPSTKSA